MGPSSATVRSNIAGDGCRVGEVGSDRDRAPARLGDLGDDLLGSGRLAAVVHDDGRARAGEVAHGVGADAARGARHEGDASVERSGGEWAGHGGDSSMHLDTGRAGPRRCAEPRLSTPPAAASALLVSKRGACEGDRMDVLTQYAWIVWLVLILVFATIEVFTLEMTFLMLALGSVAGLLSGLFGIPWWAQFIIAAVVAVGAHPHAPATAAADAPARRRSRTQQHRRAHRGRGLGRPHGHIVGRAGSSPEWRGLDVAPLPHHRAGGCRGRRAGARDRHRWCDGRRRAR